MALYYIEHGEKSHAQELFYEKIRSHINILINARSKLHRILELNDVNLMFIWNAEELSKIVIKASGINIIVYSILQSEFVSLPKQVFDNLDDLKYYTIYPNLIENNLVFPDFEKVIDCIYCKTVRVRYDSLCISQELPVMNLEDHINDFLNLSEFYKYFDINPSRFDGFISKRVEEGVLITSSRTDKYNFDSERICLIANINGNIIEWFGKHKPSSETFCAFYTFKKFSSCNYLLHFHKKDITYSEEYNFYRSIQYVTYGTKDESDALQNQFDKSGNFAILNGHGEFYKMDSLLDTEKLINLAIR